MTPKRRKAVNSPRRISHLNMRVLWRIPINRLGIGPPISLSGDMNALGSGLPLLEKFIAKGPKGRARMFRASSQDGRNKIELGVLGPMNEAWGINAHVYENEPG